tara:strand:- start:69 stop:302 length:234 start_codon:yes stop_codon:yes gene_type:complete
MRFIDNSDKTYKASTKEELLYELYKTSFAKVHSIDLDDWVDKCALRIEEQYKVVITYNNSVGFIDELIKHNFIKEIN